MYHITTRDAIPAVPKAFGKEARDVIALCDLPGLATLADMVPASTNGRRKCISNAQWYGNKNYDKSVEQIRSGDLSGVAASDALMSKLETAVPLSQSWHTRLDVVGGVPNVPAFLAGHPYNMRRRERIMSQQAPLAIIASLELSGGIDIGTMRKRGSVMLALVRRLSNIRPVELFVACSVGDRRRCGKPAGAHVICRIDTAPLDLARAAHVLTCPSVTRGIGYAIGDYLLQNHIGDKGTSWSGGWAYGDDTAYRPNAREIIGSVANPTSEALYLAPAHVRDPMVTDPIKWLKEKLVEFGGVELEAA